MLDRISNGVLAEDRRTAVSDLQSIVAESRAAQLAFGAMGKILLHFLFVAEYYNIELVVYEIFLSTFYRFSCTYGGPEGRAGGC